MRGFSSFLRSGEIGKSSKRTKDGASGEESDVDDAVSRISTFVATGKVRSSGRNSSGTSKATSRRGGSPGRHSMATSRSPGSPAGASMMFTPNSTAAPLTNFRSPAQRSHADPCKTPESISSQWVPPQRRRLSHFAETSTANQSLSASREANGYSNLNNSGSSSVPFQHHGAAISSAGDNVNTSEHLVNQDDNGIGRLNSMSFVEGSSTGAASGARSSGGVFVGGHGVPSRQSTFLQDGNFSEVGVSSVDDSDEGDGVDSRAGRKGRNADTLTNPPPFGATEPTAPGFGDFSDDEADAAAQSTSLRDHVSGRSRCSTIPPGGAASHAARDGRTDADAGTEAARRSAAPATGAILVEKTLAPYRPIAGDAPSVNTPAVRYTFDTSTLSWKSTGVYLRVLHPNRGYHQDDLHVYFAVELVVNAATRIPMVAKVYRRLVTDVREDDYFGEGQCQALAEAYARQFNRLRPRPGVEKPTLPLLTCRTVVRIEEAHIPTEYLGAKTGFYSYVTSDTAEVVFMMEPNTVLCRQIDVNFAEEMGMASYEPSTMSTVGMKELVEAFSHFSYSKSARQLLVTGLQRYAGYLVEPVVYTAEEDGYGMTNRRGLGMRTWANEHVCTPICRAIGLLPLDSDGATHRKSAPLEDDNDASDAVQKNYYVSLSHHITDYSHACVPKKHLALPPRTVAALAKAGYEPLTRSISSRPVTEEKSVALPQAKKKVSPVADATPLPVPPPVVAAAATAAAPPPVADDKSSATLSGYKYIFNSESQQWYPVEVSIAVARPSRPFKKDRQSICFEVEETVPGFDAKRMHARLLTKEKVAEADYFSVMDAATLAAGVAAAFNNLKKETIVKKFVHFMERHVVRVKVNGVAAEELSKPFFQHRPCDSKDLLLLLEPIDFEAQYARLAEDYMFEHTLPPLVDSDDDMTNLSPSTVTTTATEEAAQAAVGATKDHDKATPGAKGTGVKAAAEATAAIAGKAKGNDAIEWRQVLETFSHFSYTCLNHEAVVTGARFAGGGKTTTTGDDDAGPRGSLVDPCVHTYDGFGFAGVNEGNSAVIGWSRGHKCNALCMMLGLPPITSGAAAPSKKKSEKGQLGALLHSVGSHNIFPATKHTFNSETLQWTPSRIYVRVPTPGRGFAMGAMRVVFDVAEVSSGTAPYEAPRLAKLFRHNIIDVVARDYFNEGALQNLCGILARTFVEKTSSCPTLTARGTATQLEFIPTSVVSIARDDLPDALLAPRNGFFSYRTKDTQQVMFTMEEKLNGRFTKYNNNGSALFLTPETRLSPNEARRRTHVLEAADALSHFTISSTKGALLVCDVQGVDRRLTDPEIHTHDGEGMGMGNRGQDGMRDFVARHRCNFVCKAMKLPDLRFRIPAMGDPEKNEWVARLRELHNMPTSH